MVGGIETGLDIRKYPQKMAEAGGVPGDDGRGGAFSAVQRGFSQPGNLLPAGCNFFQFRERRLNPLDRGFIEHGGAVTAVAEALGGRGVDVTSRAELRRAVTEGLAADTFTLVAAQIERQAYDGRF